MHLKYDNIFFKKKLLVFTGTIEINNLGITLLKGSNRKW